MSPIKALSTFNGWTRWALCSTVLLLWTVFFMFIYSCMYQHDICDASRHWYADHCAHLDYEVKKLNKQLDFLRAEYGVVLDEKNKELSQIRTGERSNATRSNSKEFYLTSEKENFRTKAHYDHENGLQRVSPEIPNARRLISKKLYSREHEEQRRVLHNGLMELYYYLTSPAVQKKLNPDAQRRTKEQVISVIAESFKLGEDIDKVNEWHSATLTEISSKIQTTITTLQHPTDCSKARLLVCDFNKACGFGCQIHHVVYCLMMGAISKRTVVLEKDGMDWRYTARGGGWTVAFKPISKCSYKNDIASQAAEYNEQWKNHNQQARIVHLPVVDVLLSRPPQLPLSIPAQFAEALLTHCSNPPVFIVSQFLQYTMRENEQLHQEIVKAEGKVPFNLGPIVGFHIRRTDKLGSEASFHALEDYMEWAKLWFHLEQHRRGKIELKRRIFIATDDKNVVNEARKKYGTEFEIYENEGSAETAQLKNRYTEQSLVQVISDLRLLSKCDYIVCTFSSQICRVAYELMQQQGRGDMTERAHSLDDIYYFGGQHAHNWEAKTDYNASGRSKNEIDLQVGDIVGIAGNHWDGFSKGLNRRTGKFGLFPSYMAREKWRIIDFPIFDGIN